MEDEARISAFGRMMRKPWYAFWNLVQRVFYTGRAYPLAVPHGQRIYAPWFESGSVFASLMTRARASGPMAVSRDRCFILYQLLRSCLLLPGDVVEFGVYTGGTATLIAEVMRAQKQEKRCLHLFDTFEGMPSLAVPERDYHSPGDFGDTSLEFVKGKRLAKFSSFCSFHQGVMPDTFTELPASQRFCFAHVDVDIYESVRVCFKFAWARLETGGVILFDDYGFYPYRHAARTAVDEFCDSQNIVLVALPTGQAFATKRER
ncbi:MAG: TylF/MycF/NovP-related O-methyltransferase [Acidobacteriota bacterium]